MYQRLLYTSRAIEPITMADVYDIIRLAHNRNSTYGVTGGLLFLDGHFIQMIEGAPYAVAARYQWIKSDPRHHDIALRLQEKTNSRLFPTEWMALRSTSEIDPRVFERFHYDPANSLDTFSGTELKEFLLACFAESPVLSACEKLTAFS